MSSPAEVLDNVYDAIDMVRRNMNDVSTANDAVKLSKEAATMMIEFYKTVRTSMETGLGADTKKLSELKQKIMVMEEDLRSNKFTYQKKIGVIPTSQNKLRHAERDAANSYALANMQKIYDDMNKRVKGVTDAMNSTWLAAANELMLIKDDADIIAVEPYATNDYDSMALDRVVYCVAWTAVLTQKAMLEKENMRGAWAKAFTMSRNAKDALTGFFDSWPHQRLMAEKPVGVLEKERAEYKAAEKERMEKEEHGVNSSGGRRKHRTLHNLRKQRKQRTQRKQRKQRTQRK